MTNQTKHTIEYHKKYLISKEEEIKRLKSINSELVESLELLIDGINTGNSYSIDDGISKAKQALTRTKEGTI